MANPKQNTRGGPLTCLCGASRVGVLLVLISLLVLGCGAAPPPETAPPDADADETYTEKEVTVTDLTLGAGDEIEISVWRHPDLDGAYKIDAQGEIFIPLAGVLQVDDVSALELRGRIVEALSEYLVNPQVNVTITARRSRKVHVLGEVEKPGLYNIGEDTETLMRAVARAGGLTDDANSRRVFVLRHGLDQQEPEVYDFKSALRQGDFSQNPVLNPGDVVYVPVSFIANVDRFFEHLRIILRPILMLEHIIILAPSAADVLRGDRPGGTIIIQD